MTRDLTLKLPTIGTLRWLAVVGLLCAVLGTGRVVRGQDRPSEGDMFGAPPTDPTPAPPTAAAAQPADDAAQPAPDQPAASGETQASPRAAEAAPTATTVTKTDARDEQALGAGSTPMFNQEAAVSDPLTLGGQLYLRASTTALRNSKVKDYGFTMPSLLDVYLDARPNDRVRGFVLGRMSYDPMQPETASTPLDTSGTGSMLNNSGTSGLTPSLSTTQTNAPRVVLDQFWLRFDLWHTLFATVGRQHVRWGTARFWTPGDFLHLRRRNPLDVFDARRGTDMIKLHLPIESNSWNFYAYAITSGQNDVSTPMLSTIAGAARAEFVADSNELGLGAFVRRGSHAKFEADLSMGIGDFDVYAEAALLQGSDYDRVRFVPDAMLPDTTTPSLQQAVDAFYPSYRNPGYKPQVTGGLTYTRKYNDNDTFTLGLEYFYNGLGYSNADSTLYLGLAAPHTTALRDPATFFYFGRHYAALFLLFPSPYSWDLHSFTLSTLGNLSDHSFISRLDYSLQLLTHLRFEVFLSINYGKRTGEFRFGIDSPVPDVRPREPMLFSLGMALRAAI